MGDNLQHLKEMEPDSIDSVVTDPPYGLSFMNKKWDHDVPSVEFWREVLRVLKPGGHVLSFGGTRTYHRMAVAIEDAGFEIRDQIMWLYGSGFPKSYNISKGIDKKFGTEGEVLGVNPSSRPNSKTKGGKGFDASLGGESAGVQTLKTPGHDLAKQWDGWGTALKPANEPIVLARKPLSEKNIVDNILKHGVGGLNIDECRIETNDNLNGGAHSKNKKKQCEIYGNLNYETDGYIQPQGRFPANILLDEVAAEMLDEPSRFFYCAKASKSERNRGLEGMPAKEWKEQGFRDNDTTHLSPRAGAGRTSANQNHHPTVKPIKLMEYLVKLVTPPNGIVLDPFMGSGTTGIACKNLNKKFIGIEKDENYFEIAKNRIEEKTNNG